mgnify:CR=1 FL=1
MLKNMLDIPFFGAMMRSPWTWRLLRVAMLGLLFVMIAYGWHQHAIPGDGTRQLRGRVHTHTAEAVRPVAHTVEFNWPVTLASYPRIVTSYNPLNNITDTIYIDTEGVTNANEIYNTTLLNTFYGVAFSDAGETGFSSCSLDDWRGTPLEGNDNAFRFFSSTLWRDDRATSPCQRRAFT